MGRDDDDVLERLRRCDDVDVSRRRRRRSDRKNLRRVSRTEQFGQGQQHVRDRIGRTDDRERMGPIRSDPIRFGSDRSDRLRTGSFFWRCSAPARVAGRRSTCSSLIRRCSICSPASFSLSPSSSSGFRRLRSSPSGSSASCSRLTH